MNLFPFFTDIIRRVVFNTEEVLCNVMRLTPFESSQVVREAG